MNAATLLLTARGSTIDQGYFSKSKGPADWMRGPKRNIEFSVPEPEKMAPDPDNDVEYPDLDSRPIDVYTGERPAALYLPGDKSRILAQMGQIEIPENVEPMRDLSGDFEVDSNLAYDDGEQVLGPFSYIGRQVNELPGASPRTRGVPQLIPREMEMYDDGGWFNPQIQGIQYQQRGAEGNDVDNIGAIFGLPGRGDGYFQGIPRGTGMYAGGLLFNPQGQGRQYQRRGAEGNDEDNRGAIFGLPGQGDDYLQVIPRGTGMYEGGLFFDPQGQGSQYQPRGPEGSNERNREALFGSPGRGDYQPRGTRGRGREARGRFNQRGRSTMRGGYYRGEYRRGNYRPLGVNHHGVPSQAGQLLENMSGVREGKRDTGVVGRAEAEAEPSKCHQRDIRPQD